MTDTANSPYVKLTDGDAGCIDDHSYLPEVQMTSVGLQSVKRTCDVSELPSHLSPITEIAGLQVWTGCGILQPADDLRHTETSAVVRALVSSNDNSHVCILECVNVIVQLIVHFVLARKSDERSRTVQVKCLRTAMYVFCVQIDQSLPIPLGE